jgi:polypeptide N-acetylgalactosaminyltransferase
MQRTEGRDRKPEASSRQVTPKQTSAQGAQKTPFIAARGMPLIKISAHTGPIHVTQEALKNDRLRSDTSKLSAEKDLNATINLRTDRSKQHLQAVANERTQPASPPVLKFGKVISLNKTETQSQEPKSYKHQAHKSLPFFKLIADSNRLKKQSMNETQFEGFPKDGGAIMAPEKKLNFSESHIVIVTKEEELKTDTKEVSSSKTKITFPKVLGRSQAKHTSRNGSEVSFSSLALQKTIVSQTKQALAGGLEPAKINITAKAHPAEHNESHPKVLLPEDHGKHHVLRIDVTLSPRDPKAPGQFGRPVVVPPGKEKEAERRWKEGNFNVYLSDLIPVDRAIEDTRPAG